MFAWSTTRLKSCEVLYFTSQMIFHRFLQYFRVIFTKQDSFVHLKRLKCVVNASIRKFTSREWFVSVSAASVCQFSCTEKTGQIPKLEELLFLSKTSTTLSLATRDIKLESNIVNSRKQQFSNMTNDDLLINCALVPINFDFGLVLTSRNTRKCIVQWSQVERLLTERNQRHKLACPTELVAILHCLLVYSHKNEFLQWFWTTT